MEEYMPTDKQYNGQLIDEYYYLCELYESAVTESAVNTAKAIKKKMECIRLKLQPLELPELPQ